MIDRHHRRPSLPLLAACLTLGACGPLLQQDDATGPEIDRAVNQAEERGERAGVGRDGEAPHIPPAGDRNAQQVANSFETGD